MVLLNRLRYRPSNNGSWNMVMVFRVKGENREEFLILLHRLSFPTSKICSLRIFAQKYIYILSYTRKPDIPLFMKKYLKF